MHIKDVAVSYPLLLLYITLLAFAANYSPGTFLTGWDNLHPEFNFWLNIQRNLTGVWQEYRGLGLYDGQAHMANLVHTLFTAVMSVILPVDAIRYVFMTAALYLGGLGLYRIALHITRHKPSAFIAALFYMFNIGIIQQFFAPLESFVVHFALLPWTFLYALRFIHYKKYTDLVLFFVIAVISTPQAFIPTIFVTFSLSFFALGYYDYILHKNIKQFVVLGLLLFAANAFWFLPYANGALSNAAVIKDSRINQFISEDNYLRNKARGNMGDVVAMKGFMLDLEEYDGATQERFRLMQAWEDYSHTLPYIVGYIFFLSVIAAGAFLVLKEKNREMYPVLIAGGIALLFLSNNVPVLSHINQAIRAVIPLLAEALRNPFTKFITIFAFSMSLVLAYGLKHFLQNYKKSHLICGLAYISIIFITVPVITGNLFSPVLKRTIPDAYFKMFSYMEKQDHAARTAYLPAENFWSWQAWKWGYVGSGMAWFGIPQPLLVRAFDPWSLYNEQFYNELSHAIKQKDAVQLEDILEKYNVTYLILDTSRVDSVSERPIDYSALAKLLEGTEGIEKEETWDFLHLYRNTEAHARISTVPVTQVPKIGSQYLLTHYDQAYADLGTYVVNADNPDYIYPFPSLFTERSQQDIQFSVQHDKDSYVISSPELPAFDNEKYRLEVPDILSEAVIPVQIRTTANGLAAYPAYPGFDGLQQKTATLSAEPLIEIPESTASAILISRPSQRGVVGDIFYLPAGKTTTLQIQQPGGTTRYTVDIPLNDAPVTRYVRLQNSVSRLGLRFSKRDVLAYGSLSKKNRNIFISKADDTQDQHDDDSYIEYENPDQDTNFILKAKNNTIAMVTYKDNLPHNMGYIGFPYVKHYSGLPMIFFVDNTEAKRVEQETRLNPDREENIIVVPPTKTATTSGYAFHFNVTSVGSEVARAEIGNFILYPLPYSFIQKIRFSRFGTTKTGNIAQLEPVQFDQKSFSRYIARVKSQADQFLVFDQAYHDGWVAYEVSATSGIQQLVPFIGGKKLDTHVLMNNWANGWFVSAATDSATSPNGEKTIVIVFMPQYLQYIGFFLAILGTIILPVWPFIPASLRRKLLMHKRNHTPLPEHLHRIIHRK